jgi:hypothetical protein
MTQHFTQNTVSAAFWCGKCQRSTQHRIDKGRKGPCLGCVERLEKQHAEQPMLKKPAASSQGSLF